MDIDSFKKAVDGVDEWFVKELEKEGYDDAQELVDLFTQESTDTVISTGRKQPGTLHAPQRRQVPGQTADVSLAS